MASAIRREIDMFARLSLCAGPILPFDASDALLQSMKQRSVRLCGTLRWCTC